MVYLTGGASSNIYQNILCGVCKKIFHACVEVNVISSIRGEVDNVDSRLVFYEWQLMMAYWWREGLSLVAAGWYLWWVVEWLWAAL